MTICKALPTMDCLQSCQKQQTSIHWQWHMHWLSIRRFVCSCRLHIHTINLNLNVRAYHAICNINPTKSHAQTFCFPCARRDPKTRPKSTFWCGRPRASLSARRGLTEVGNRIPQPYSVSLKVSQTAGERQQYSEKRPHSSTKKLTRGVPNWAAFWHTLGIP